jgi:prepilin peptidase CpaA
MAPFSAIKKTADRLAVTVGITQGCLALGIFWMAVAQFITIRAAVYVWAAATLGLLLAVSSYTDIRWRRVPNWATYTACLGAFAVNSVFPLAMQGDSASASGLGSLPFPPLVIGLQNSVCGAAVCFAVMFFVYGLAGGGAGDVKLATAIGALVGPAAGLTIITWCYLTAGAALLIWIAWQLGPFDCLRLVVTTVGQVFQRGKSKPLPDSTRRLLLAPVPMAVFFAIGTIITLSGVLQ